MTFKVTRTVWASVVVSLLSRAPVVAKDKEDFTAEAWAGIEYGSNVAVLEVDQSSGAGDFASVFDGAVAYRKSFGSNVEVEASYDFFQSLQFDFSDLNLRTHRPAIDIAYKIGDGRVGLNYFYVDAALAGDGFLNIHQVVLYGESPVGPRGYVRGSYTHAEKSFADSRRSGESYSGSLIGFYFFNEAKIYGSLSYQYTDEEARAAQFTYAGHSVRAKVVHKMPLADEELRLEAGASWEARDYEGFPVVLDTSIGIPVEVVIPELREDERVRLELAAERPLHKQVTMRLNYEHNILNSTVPSVDFTEDVVALRFGYRY